MKRIINSCLLLSTLIGYLEWGKGYHGFFYQAEAEIFSKVFSNPLSVLHPFTVIPFAGQLLILITIFQRNPSRILSLVGLGCLSIIMLFVLFIGIMSFNIRITASIIPFVISGIMLLKYNWKKALPEQVN